MSFYVAPIVEGYGDVAAIPLLIRAIRADAQVARPARFPKNKLIQQAWLTRAVDIAAANIPRKHRGLVLLVIDADEDCSATLGPQLLSWMQHHAPKHKHFVALCVREYESWILGGISDFNCSEPDTAGKPKERVRNHNDGLYSETADQPRYTSKIDIKLLKDRSKSFKRLYDQLSIVFRDDEVVG